MSRWVRSQPPASVLLVARTHAAVAAVIFASTGLLFALTRRWPVELEPITFRLSLGLGSWYGLAGYLVWRGLPPGRWLSRICGLLYLARPGLGSQLWRIMDSEEYQSHFRRRVDAAGKSR